LAVLFIFSLSLLWTEVDNEIALLTLVKHGKLLEILLLASLIRTTHEARIGITAFLAGQTFLLISSWLLAIGVPIPWITTPIGRNVVFSSYLDQSIIFAGAATVFWHLQTERIGPRWLACMLAAAALINVFLLLDGRTGYVVSLTVIALAVMWAMPKRWRIVTLIATPVLVLFVLYLGSAKVQERVSKIIHESQEFAQQGGTESSSGWRLNAWHRSVQAITESPWLGHGVGSWTVTIKRIEGSAATQTFGEGKASNPHQEYLLWGVELGLGGSLLLLTLMGCIVRDALQFKPPIAHATISVTAALAVACLFNSTLYDGLIGDFFCVALGLLMALGLRTQSHTENQPTAEGFMHMKARL
jgi:O-antigen ligase